MVVQSLDLERSGCFVRLVVVVLDSVGKAGGGGGSLDTQLRRCVICLWIRGKRSCYWTSLGAYGLVKSYSAVLLHPPSPLSMIPLVKEMLLACRTIRST